MWMRKRDEEGEEGWGRLRKKPVTIVTIRRKRQKETRRKKGGNIEKEDSARGKRGLRKKALMN